MDLGRFSKRIILTGAGFSKNFGGLLGREIADALLVHPFIQIDGHVSGRLKKDRHDFEKSLATLRQRLPKRAKVLEKGLLSTFKMMDQHMATPGDPFGINTRNLNLFLRRTISGWDKCDTGFIFTLNQDLLLERIMNNWGTQPYWCHPPHHPGVPPPRVATSGGRHFFHGDLGPFTDDFFTVVPQEIERESLVGRTNYIKLHGSFNWRSEDSSTLLIAGGDKGIQISGSNLLRWYSEIFSSVLHSGDVKLFVIGYSFRDPHINEVILSAVEKARLHVFILDPAPYACFDQLNYPHTGSFTPLHCLALQNLIPERGENPLWGWIVEGFMRQTEVPSV